MALAHPRAPALSRRAALTAAARSAAVLAAAASLPGVARASEEAPAGLRAAPRAPDEALHELMAGNERFVAGKITAPHRNLARLKEVARKQRPFAAFLGCADSRVPIEIVFDQGFGDVFPVRVAGNVATPEVIGSLEYSAFELGTQLVFVLGHSACGAVTATMHGEAAPGQISSLYWHIQPAVDDAKGDLAVAVAANVRNQVKLLRRASPVLSELAKEGKLKVVGGVYDLSSGRVTMIDV
jgi:carbonic anhydrase